MLKTDSFLAALVSCKVSKNIVAIVCFFLVVSADAQTPKEIVIGNQVWMAENANTPVSGSVCYENDPKNCETYGRLYTWEQALEACPDGWHLPTDKEWIQLTEFLGGEKIAREELKAGGKSGFNALMSGGVDTEGSFLDLGIKAYFWTATETERYSSDYAWYRYLFEVDYEDYSSAPMRVVYTKRGYCAVRCIKN